MPKLITKSELAKRAGVNGSSVTRYIKNHPEIEVRGRIDADHPLVVKYLAKKSRKGKQLHLSAGGSAIVIDALYDEATALCKSVDIWTAATFRKAFGIGGARAKKLFEALHAAGIRPAPIAKPEPAKPAAPAPKAKPATKAKPTPKPLPQLAPAESDYGVDELPDDIRGLVHWPLIKIIKKFGTAHGFESYLKSAKIIEDIAEKRIKNFTTNGELIAKALVVKTVIEPLDTAFARMLRDGSRSVTSILTNRIKAGDTFEQCEAEVTKQLSAFIKPLKNTLGRGIL